MYGYESWTLKKAEHQRSDAFKLRFWRIFLSPLDCRRSNQSILKEIHPEYSLEGLILKPELQNFGHLMWRTDSFEKTLMLGKIGGKGQGDSRGWDGWMASLSQWTWVWAISRRRRTGKSAKLHFMWSQKVGHNWATELNWTELNWRRKWLPTSGMPGEIPWTEEASGL